MAQAVSELNSQISALEKQIADAKKNKEDPETIRSMEDQLAMLKKQVSMMGGLNKKILTIPDKTVKVAIEEDENTNGIPKRDVARINALPKKTLTDAELGGYVQKIFTAVDKNISPSQKTNAKELYNDINAKEKSPVATGNIALLYWMAGSTDIALWLLGKACVDDPSDADNLNNYASCLSMVGGEHLAIPLLQNLSGKFPNNTTVMNNLGQAWYGLGEMNNAKKYISGTIMLMAAHPYAQETICGIEEAEGLKDESIESMKQSIKEDYTPEKEAALEQKGYHVKFEDFRFKYPTKAEPLGIEKFLSPPPYVFEGGEPAQINRMEWDDYKEKIGDAVSALQQTKKEIDDKVDQYQKRLFGNLSSQNIKSYKDVDVAALAGRVNPLLKPYNNKVYKTARRKYELLIVWYTERFLALDKKIKESEALVEQYRNDYNLALQNEKENCGGKFAAATTFNSKANELWQQRNTELLTLEKEFLNARSNYSLYASLDPSIYEQDILNIKLDILGFLSSLRHENEVGCMPPKDIPKPHGKTLPDFDEMNCHYKTELSIPYAEKNFSIKIECNKMTTNFDLKYVKGSIEENLAHGTYKGTVEIQGKIGSDKQQYGPIELGTQVKAAVGVDFTEGGIQDVYVSGKVGVKAGVADDVGLTISPSSDLGSLEGRMSVITGKGSVTGKGAFSGISIK
jgi:uncharacterized protein YbcI